MRNRPLPFTPQVVHTEKSLEFGASSSLGSGSASASFATLAGFDETPSEVTTASAGSDQRWRCGVR
jgi:hypothetical protein